MRPAAIAILFARQTARGALIDEGQGKPEASAREVRERGAGGSMAAIRLEA